MAYIETFPSVPCLPGFMLCSSLYFGVLLYNRQLFLDVCSGQASESLYITILVPRSLVQHSVAFVRNAHILPSDSLLGQAVLGPLKRGPLVMENRESLNLDPCPWVR